PIIFVFRYAPRDWLQAKEIIPYSPRPSPSPQLKPKRERTFSSDVIDIDDLHTDDENPVATKRSVRLNHPPSALPLTLACIVSLKIPPSVAPRKKQRTVKREAGVKTEVEDD
ncbi:unnamed protein product, partial [Rhizoctonia solani]